MKMVNRLILIFILTMLLTACTQDNKTMILGVWESDQISQSTDSNEEFGHYNYLEITDKGMNAKTFNYVSVEGGALHKRFNEEQQEMTYEWKAENQIEVGNRSFEVEIEKNQMILRNDHIEIHYVKQK